MPLVAGREDMDVELKIVGFTPHMDPLRNMVLYYFHHPFLETPI